MMNTARQLVACLACVAMCQAAQADRSRLGDDSDVIDAGDCELEVAAERKRANGAVREKKSSIQLNCGIGWRSELAAAFATTRSDVPSVQALGVEGKTSLRDRQDGRLGWTLAYGVDAERGAGSAWRRNAQFVALEASLAVDKAWLLEAKLGTARDRALRSGSTTWALGVERALAESFEARLELEGDDRQRPLWRAGLRYQIWPDHALLSLSYGSRTGPTRERQAGLAVTFEF